MRYSDDLSFHPTTSPRHPSLVKLSHQANLKVTSQPGELSFSLPPGTGHPRKRWWRQGQKSWQVWQHRQKSKLIANPSDVWHCFSYRDQMVPFHHPIASLVAGSLWQKKHEEFRHLLRKRKKDATCGMRAIWTSRDRSWCCHWRCSDAEWQMPCSHYKGKEEVVWFSAHGQIEMACNKQNWLHYGSLLIKLGNEKFHFLHGYIYAYADKNKKI